MNCREARRVALGKAARVLEAALNSPEFFEGDGVETEADADRVAGAAQHLIDGLWKRVGGRTSNFTPEDR